MDRGVLYIAFGDEFVDEARHSARSVRRHSPGLGIALFADVDPGDPAFDLVRAIEPGHERAQVDLIADSPFERTLYLDSDTEVVRDIADTLDVLDCFDVAMTHDFARRRPRYASVIPEYDAIPYSFPEMNGGLMACRRSPAVAAFLADWRELFHRYREVTSGWDQATLRVALWRADLRLHTFPVEYNVRSASNRRRADKLVGTGQAPGLLAPRVLHWHGLHRSPRWWSRLSPKYRPYRY